MYLLLLRTSVRVRTEVHDVLSDLITRATAARGVEVGARNECTCTARGTSVHSVLRNVVVKHTVLNMGSSRMVLRVYNGLYVLSDLLGVTHTGSPSRYSRSWCHTSIGSAR